MKHLYRCILILLLIALLGLLIFLFWRGQEAAIIDLLSAINLSEKKDTLLPLISKFPSWFVFVPLFLLLVFLFIALYEENTILRCIKQCFSYCKQAFVNLFITLKTWEIVAVMFIPFLASIYFANTVAVSYDEAITYNFFTVKPFFYCMIFYPYPNNHVLHSLLTNITEYIPFASALFSIRIPAILASLFTWLVGYSFLKKQYSSRVALIVVGIASIFYMSIYYSFMSRGYAFMVLAFVVCMYAAFNIIQKGSRNKDWMFFVVAGVLGCYTIPSFLYPFATLNFLIFIYNYKNIKQQIVANLLAGVAVLLLYAPIMMIDGISALTSNQFVQHIERMDILTGIFFFYRAMLADIAGVPYVVVALTFIPLILTIAQKDKWHLSLWAIFMLAPFVLLFIHAVNPFYRTFLYYNFIILFLMVVPFKKYLEYVPKKSIITIIILLQIISVYNFSTRIEVDEGFNTDAAEVSKLYFKNNQTIIFPCVASANYEFEAKVKGLENDIRFLNNNKANVDTINNCDYIIIEKWRDETIDKKPIFESAEQNIYKNER